MIRSDDIARAIRDAPQSEHPFPHLSLTGVFSADDYRDMLRLLPPSDCYAELRHKDARASGRDYTRREFLLTDENLSHLRDAAMQRLWRECAEALRHPDVRQALFARLASDAPGSRARTTMRLSLLRDLPGYFIRPHRDIPRKILTAQIYLPSDGRGVALGTQLYGRTPSGALERAATIPYLPNSGYAFSVNADSWHGVDTIPAGTAPRDSLMLIWYLAGAAAPLHTAVRRAVNWLESVRAGGLREGFAPTLHQR